ncbi:peptidase M23 [Marinithermofilum abyssi]|uniref:Peptidase M23 n=1 Tax=Marinithermofilum abyssi TaxID=1571185 RepID=A0A8J2VKC9_9BACL|nr:peptidoglycan DD-metalloendopeptidase family protein [Marinithermofilum abyssi]GGE28673.1 peptidase M23 [Marinithermofilum abyssi]
MEGLSGNSIIKLFLGFLSVTVLAFLLLVGGFLAVLFMDSDSTPKQQQGSAAESEQAKKEIPKDLIPKYKAAQKRFPAVKWQYLAAIHKVETGYGRTTSPGDPAQKKMISSANALGPMQFTPQTWKDFGIDGNGDGVADIWNEDDAIFSAANKLSKQGIDTNVDQAILRYNRSSEYVKNVKTIAKSYMADPVQVANTGGKVAEAAGGFVWPVSTKKISSKFGMRLHPTKKIFKLHDGVDFPEANGKPVHAIKAGKVIRVANDANGYGLFVEIDHGSGGITSLYGHLSEQSVSVGQVVSAGQVIGKVGSTGASTGNHLHLTIKVNGDPVNPETILR